MLAVDCHNRDSLVTQAEIGAWLADRREAAGLTQMEAAAKIGKQSGLLSKWERGELRMSAVSFLTLVELYGAARELPAILAKWERFTGAAADGKARERGRQQG